MLKSIIFLSTILLSISVYADFTGRVVKVTDGDTINVLVAGNILHKVRLTSIDAPERGQAYGRKSKEYLADMVAGKQVVVESEKQDRYGRDLGKVILNGKDINLEQVKAGMAWWYRYYKKEQPRADQMAYEAAEDSAKANRLGLWTDPSPIKPYEWRKNH